MDVAADGEAAEHEASVNDYDLIILDVMLPRKSGLEVCRELRAAGSAVPVLMLTAKGFEVSHEEMSQRWGVRRVIAKPFSPRELVARVKALLRRTHGSEVAWMERLSFDGGALQIDAGRHRVTVRGEPVPVTPSEFKLLLALAQSPGRVFSRYELIYRVRGYDYAGYERTIDAHIKNLRKKIEVDPASPRYVETVHGIGYRLAETSR